MAPADPRTPEPSTANRSTADPHELLALATDLAGQAVAVLVEGVDRARVLVESKSSPTDMVTEIDRASEATIVGGVLAARPDDGVVGEEGSVRAGTSGIRWVVDPLDGTTNYLYGHPGFAVSIAVEDGDGALVGVVADPLHGDVFTAVRGEGAWRNGEPIRCTDAHALATALVATGFSYESARRARQAHVLTTVLPTVRDIRRHGAAAVDLCWVACGRVDAFYERGLAPWDLAAGALVAREAGAVTSDLDGGPASSEMTIAAPPRLIGALRSLLREAGAREA